MDLQSDVKRSDIEYLLELIDKNAPVKYNSITEE